MGFPRKTYIYRARKITVSEAIDLLLRHFGEERLNMPTREETEDADTEEIVNEYNGRKIRIGDIDYTFVVTPHDHRHRYFIGCRKMIIEDIGTTEDLRLIDVPPRPRMEADLGGPVAMVAIAADCACCT